MLEGGTVDLYYLELPALIANMHQNSKNLPRPAQ